MRDLSISVIFARAVLKNAVEQGLDVVALLRKNRISPRLLQENNARISIERFADLQVGTIIAMQDEALGYSSQRMPIGTWSMMCHAVIGSATLGQALARYCRFFQLFEFGLRPRLEIEGDFAHIKIEPFDDNPADQAYSGQSILFNTHRFSSWLIQEFVPIHAIDLNTAAWAQPDDYRRMFLSHPVSFEQAGTQLIISASLLEKRVTQNEQTLSRFLRHPILIMLTENYARSSWTAQVRNRVRHDLANMPELNEVAAHLDVHPQTLRRRLSAEGTHFKEIKSQLRRDTALHFLGKQGLSIEEIAHRAGFSEPSAFIRAFKGWTGVTPYTYRKGL